MPDSDYIRSSILDSIAESGGLVVLQLVGRNDGLYDIYRAKRGRLPETVASDLSAADAREYWAKALTRMFEQFAEDGDELAFMVGGRVASLFRNADDPTADTE
ncbi:MAG TPA: hypothetical protein VFK72_05630 [Nevskia sp.]|nr:hypothetical protein [Nevskia sp.]